MLEEKLYITYIGLWYSNYCTRAIDA